MRFISLSLFLLCAALAFGADCNTSGYACVNMDSQIKGSRFPSFGVDAGAANAYSVTTVAPLGPALKPGSSIMFFALHTNTAASTLAVDGGSAIALKTMGLSSLSAGMIGTGGFVYATYDGTQFQCVTCSSGALGSGASFTDTGLIGPSASPSLSTTGTTGAITYGYCVVANIGISSSSSGGTTACSPANFIATGNATLSGSNFINISWTAITGATSYDIYRSLSNGTPATVGKLTTGDCPATASTSCHDKGDTANGVPPSAVNTSGQTVAASYATAGGYGTADPRYQVYLKDEFCGKAGDLGWTTTGTITTTFANGFFNRIGGEGGTNTTVNAPCTIELGANSTTGTVSLGTSSCTPNCGLFALKGSQPLVMRVYARMVSGFSTSNGTITNQQIGLVTADGLGNPANPTNDVVFMGDSVTGTYGDFGCRTHGSGLFGINQDSGLAHDTNWHWFEIDISPTPPSATTNSSNGSMVVFKIDHTTVCTIHQMIDSYSYIPFFGVANFDSQQGDMQVDYFDLTFAVNRP